MMFFGTPSFSLYFPRTQLIIHGYMQNHGCVTMTAITSELKETEAATFFSSLFTYLLM